MTDWQAVDDVLKEYEKQEQAELDRLADLKALMEEGDS